MIRFGEPLGSLDSALQAFEALEWIDLTCSENDPDLVVFAGDFNFTPDKIQHQMLLQAGLFQDPNADLRLTTIGNPNNTFSDHNPMTLDYVLFKDWSQRYSTAATRVQLPLPPRIPGHNISFSDHEGLSVELTAVDGHRDRRESKTRLRKRDFMVQLLPAMEEESKKSLANYYWHMAVLVLAVLAAVMALFWTPDWMGGKLGLLFGIAVSALGAFECLAMHGCCQRAFRLKAKYKEMMIKCQDMSSAKAD